MTNMQSPDRVNIHDALLTATRTARECKPDNTERTLDLLKQLRDLGTQVERSPQADQAPVCALATKITEQLASKVDPKPEVLFAWVHHLLEHLRTSVGANPEVRTRGPQASDVRIDTSNLEVARYRRWMADGTRFGEIMVRMAYMKTEDVERALELQRRKNCRLGEAMVDLGLLSRRGLEAALHLQKKKREPDAWTTGHGIEDSAEPSDESSRA
jgi:hypothetical protein